MTPDAHASVDDSEVQASPQPSDASALPVPSSDESAVVKFKKRPKKLIQSVQVITAVDISSQYTLILIKTKNWLLNLE